MALDRADWHYGGNFPEDLDTECGGTHIGMFLAWIIINGLEGDLHREESQESLRRVRAREMTGRDFLFENCDEKFWEEDMNATGAAFAEHYYSAPDGYGPYLSDYENALAGALPSLYHVDDTWENYDKLAPLIDKAFSDWKRVQARGPVA